MKKLEEWSLELIGFFFNNIHPCVIVEVPSGKHGSIGGTGGTSSGGSSSDSDSSSSSSSSTSDSTDTDTGEEPASFQLH